ncbi:MAG: hypothetical protein ACMUIA_10870 [bacterium]
MEALKTWYDHTDKDHNTIAILLIFILSSTGGRGGVGERRIVKITRLPKGIVRPMPAQRNMETLPPLPAGEGFSRILLSLFYRV